jgi:hypothetical protein
MRSVISILLAFLLLASCSNSLHPDEDFSTTIIQYALSEDTHVKLWLENSYSTKVKTLVDKFQQQGNYVVPLKMIDEDNAPLPFGLYTYYIETDKYSTSGVVIYPRHQN